MEEIAKIYVGVYFSPWLATQQAWEELAAKAVYDKEKNREKSGRAIRDDVAQWKEFIQYAHHVYEAGTHVDGLIKLSTTVSNTADIFHQRLVAFKEKTQEEEESSP